jgi:hypothetical protein
VTEHPTAYWTGEQIIQAFPGGSEPRYLLRDRDRIYSQADFALNILGTESSALVSFLHSIIYFPERAASALRAS